MGRSSKRLQRAMTLREVKKQMSEQLRNDRSAPIVPGPVADADARDEVGESLREAVDAMRRRRRTATGEFQPGDMINLAVTVPHGKRGQRVNYKPALVLDGPDLCGELLLMVIGDPEPRRYPAIMCRPS
jgi:hypothetical protein